MGDLYSAVAVMGATPASPATILLITASASKRLRIRSVEFGSSNASALNGSRVSIGIPTTAGTGGASITPQVVTNGAPPAMFTALSSSTPWSVEPTQPGAYVWQQGLDVVASYVWTPPDKDGFIIPVSGRVAVRVEADQSATKVQWVCTALVEE